MTPGTDIPPVRQIARRVAVWLLLLAAGALLVTQLPGLEELPAHLASADPGWIAAALLLEIASTLAFAAAFHGAYGRRTTPRQSVTVSMAVQGANILLPAGGTGGLAVGAVILDRAGIPRSVAASRTVALFLVTSAVSFVALVVAGLGVASGALQGDAALVATLLPAVGALAILAAVAVLPRLPAPSADAPAGRARRAVWSARVHLREGVVSTAEMLRGRDWLVIGGAIGYYAFDVAALAAAFHAVGAGALPIGVLVLAYTLGHGGAIVPLPGSAEGGLIGMLVLYGAALGPATAAVLAYRAVHAGVPMVLGAAALADVHRLVGSGLAESTRAAPGGAARSLRFS